MREIVLIFAAVTHDLGHYDEIGLNMEVRSEEAD
jgi:hypothetical protein